MLPVFGRRRKKELAVSTGYVVRLFSDQTTNQPTMTTAKPKSALEMAYERVVIKKKTRDRATNTKSYRSQKRPTMLRARVKMWAGLWMESPKAR